MTRFFKVSMLCAIAALSGCAGAGGGYVTAGGPPAEYYEPSGDYSLPLYWEGTPTFGGYERFYYWHDGRWMLRDQWRYHRFSHPFWGQRTIIRNNQWHERVVIRRPQFFAPAAHFNPRVQQHYYYTRPLAHRR